MRTTPFADGCTVHQLGAGAAIVCLPGFVDNVRGPLRSPSSATHAFLLAHAIPQHELGIGHYWPWIVDPATVAALIDTACRRAVRRRPR